MSYKFNEIMHFRESRLDTFENGSFQKNSKQKRYWTHKVPEIQHLVDCGFYFDPTKVHTDRIACVSCKKKETNVEGITNMASHHLVNNPDCPLSSIIVSQLGYLNHPSLQYWKSTTPLFSDPLSKASIKLRKKTFGSNWNFDKDKKSSKATSASLAKAGFYYCPIGIGNDRVQCVYCRCSLDTWLADDDPIEEHKQNSNEDCYFLRVFQQLYIERPTKKRSRSASFSSAAGEEHIHTNGEKAKERLNAKKAIKIKRESEENEVFSGDYNLTERNGLDENEDLLGTKKHGQKSQLSSGYLTGESHNNESAVQEPPKGTFTASGNTSMESSDNSSLSRGTVPNEKEVNDNLKSKFEGYVDNKMLSLRIPQDTAQILSLDSDDDRTTSLKTGSSDDNDCERINRDDIHSLHENAKSHPSELKVNDEANNMTSYDYWDKVPGDDIPDEGSFSELKAQSKSRNILHHSFSSQKSSIFESEEPTESSKNDDTLSNYVPTGLEGENSADEIESSSRRPIGRRPKHSDSDHNKKNASFDEERFEEVLKSPMKGRKVKLLKKDSHSPPPIVDISNQNIDDYNENNISFLEKNAQVPVTQEKDTSANYEQPRMALPVNDTVAGQSKEKLQMEQEAKTKDNHDYNESEISGIFHKSSPKGFLFEKSGPLDAQFKDILKESNKRSLPNIKNQKELSLPSLPPLQFSDGLDDNRIDVQRKGQIHDTYDIKEADSQKPENKETVSPKQDENKDNEKEMLDVDVHTDMRSVPTEIHVKNRQLVQDFPADEHADRSPRLSNRSSQADQNLDLSSSAARSTHRVETSHEKDEALRVFESNKQVANKEKHENHSEEYLEYIRNIHEIQQRISPQNSDDRSFVDPETPFPSSNPQDNDENNVSATSNTRDQGNPQEQKDTVPNTRRSSVREEQYQNNVIASGGDSTNQNFIVAKGQSTANDTERDDKSRISSISPGTNYHQPSPAAYARLHEDNDDKRSPSLKTVLVEKDEDFEDEKRKLNSVNSNSATQYPESFMDHLDSSTPEKGTMGKVRDQNMSHTERAFSVLRTSHTYLSGIIDNLQDMRIASEYLNKCKSSQYTLYDDYDGDLTNFISNIPEEEENMTIEEWVVHHASNSANMAKQVCNEIIESYKISCEQAIRTIQLLDQSD